MKILNRIIASLAAIIIVASCQKEYSVDTGKNPGASAVGSLKDSLGDCQPILINGNYIADTALNASNYVKVQVNVTKTGSYVISTDMQNGFSFQDTGYFSQTGLQTVTLKGSGTPIAGVTSNFMVTFDTTYCMFQVTATGTGSGGGGGGGTTNPNTSDSAWQFTQGTKTQKGPIWDAFDTTITNSTGTGYFLILEGYTAATGDSAIELGILFPSNKVQTGTYSTATSGFFYFDDNTTSAGTTIYEADFTTTGVAMSITISSYDATTNIVQGTFTGTAKNASGATVPITGGKFKAKFR
jgi:hypothetical protein